MTREWLVISGQWLVGSGQGAACKAPDVLRAKARARPFADAVAAEHALKRVLRVA